MTTRRGFLSRTALASGALVLPSGLFTLMGGSGCSTTSRRTDHYFIFYLMVGGWDLMMTTDPGVEKEGFYRPFDDDDVVMAGDVRLGPSMKALLPWQNRLGILKGIHVDALNHPQARFRMVTGKFKPPGNHVTAPSVQTLIAQARGAGYQLPNLSSDQVRPAAFRGDVADLRLDPVRVSSIEQLKALTNLKGDVGKSRREIEEVLRQKDALTAKHWKTSSSSDLPDRFAAFADLERDLAQSDYRARVAASTSVVDDAKGAMGRPNDKMQRQIKLAVEAVHQDLAPVITVGTGEFDAHSKGEYASHPAACTKGIAAVADIARGLEAIAVGNGRTLLDMTTIVVTSEFSRTPSRNELGGKHHWPTNSMLILGKGVRRTKSGQPNVFGVVDDNQVAMAINARNGSTKRGADLLDMSHGLATVLAMGGIDPGPLLGQDPIVALLS
ncbi:MAG: DUF1501 domain-containing protein [Deltaproteobacteria bacterium]|nr:DUF1501 domain-containing protein [Deltaproteobacteria bacterium]